MNEKIVDGNAIFKLCEDGSGYELYAMRDKGVVSYEIPASIEGLPVVAVGKDVFMQCKELETVYIHDGVREIGDSAFACCEKLTVLRLPQSLEKIGDWAFGYCPVASFEIPALVRKIGCRAFHDCANLKEIFIPASVEVLGDNPFEKCANLEHIEISACNARYKVEDDCLIDRNNGTLVAGCKNSKIPQDGSIKAIGVSAFNGCTGLKNVKIPASVVTIANMAFEGCTSLKSIEIPEGVESIGFFAFDNCAKLKTAHIPASVAYIDDNPFMSCPNIASITCDKGNKNYFAINNCLVERERGRLLSGCKNSKIPADGSVSEIGDYAFDGCTMESIEIPSAVGEFGTGILSCCENLKTIVYAGTLLMWDYIGKDMEWNDLMSELTLVCTDGERRLYGFVE